jgi:2-dehydro-3-deoxyphosphogalactonate aldolase
VSPTEAFTALEAGAHALKLFPMDMIGVTDLKAMRAVLPRRLPLIAAGGIGTDTMAVLRKAGCSGFGLGGSFYQPGLTTDVLEGNAKATVAAVRALDWPKPA